MKIIKLRENGVFVIALLVLQVIVFIIAALTKFDNFALILLPFITLIACCVAFYLARCIMLIYGVITTAIGSRNSEN